MNHTTSTLGELDGAFAQSEQRVVLAATDVLAGMEVGATLANDDVAGDDMLAAIALHAEALRAGVTTITGRTKTFFMCHFLYLPSVLFGPLFADALNLDASEVLTMTAKLLVVLALLELEDELLLVLVLVLSLIHI